MMLPGLCSVTFRQKGIAEITAIASQCGLRSIEWGGDVHVPPGRIDLAREARQASGDFGLLIKSYGSYYCVGRDKLEDFPVVLETARELGAETVRVWAGPAGSNDIDSITKRRVYSDVLRLSEMAFTYCMSIAYEFHSNTLTDSVAAAEALLKCTDRPNIYTYWQPVYSWSCDENLAALTAIRNRLLHCHVFYWDKAGSRLLLSSGKQEWRRYLQQIDHASAERCCYLEFTQDDDIECLKKDAESLKELLLDCK